jgi:hypothetical protein
MNVYPGSEFFHPGYRVKKIPDPGSGSAPQILSIFIQANFTMLLEIWSGMFFPDPRSGFFPSRIPGSTKHRIPDPDPKHCLQVDKKLSKFSEIVKKFFFKQREYIVNVLYYTLCLSLTIFEGG